jgi:HK97 gp10 family phage protein
MAKGVTVRGIKTVLNNIAKVSQDMEKASAQAVSAAAMMVEREAKRNQTPHVDTGRLRSSIVSEKKDDFEIHVGVAKAAPKSGARFEAGSNVEYALAHEYRFPFLQPAIETARQTYPHLIAASIKKEL